MILSKPAIEEYEKKEPLFDITRKPVDKKDKGKRKEVIVMKKRDLRRDQRTKKTRKK